jgi:hypothetical protein
MAGQHEDLSLSRELAVFEARRGELLRSHPGRYALLHGEELSGVFDTEADAITAGYDRFGYVPFLVKKIEPADIPLQMASCVIPA